MSTSSLAPAARVTTTAYRSTCPANLQLERFRLRLPTSWSRGVCGSMGSGDVVWLEGSRPVDGPGSFGPDDRDLDQGSVHVSGSIRRRGLPPLSLLVPLVLIIGLGAGWSLWRDGSVDGGDRPEPDAAGAERNDSDLGSVDGVVTSAPAPLVAAERYMADPGAATLRALVDAIGGVDAVVVGEAEGAFDLVRFDPLDPNRLIASLRSSYGEAQNQGSNEIWQIGSEGLTQMPLAAETPHDFAHFNRDGTITMWVHSDVDIGFAPRNAMVMDRERSVRTTTQPLYASRFAVTGDKVFALTGDGDYYSRSDSYEQLIVDGDSRRVLGSGEAYEWIDNPIPDLLVAYTRDPKGTTAVWNTSTLERLPDHPLAGRPYKRVAVSGDRRTAVGVTFEGLMEQIDLGTGRTLSVFGSLDPEGIDRPITLNNDGTIAVTVDRSGRVDVWWVGDDTPISSVDADAAQPRWVSAKYGASSASSVATLAERIAFRSAALPQTPVKWLIVDIQVDSWISHACDMAGRALTANERTMLGLESTPAACT